ncbi:hypothetical protein [Cellulophaga baltica]|uniref:Uncharacterized protein n=1 Tax=Cellulophaga baltica TaxID=76594 RepID=A0A1G7LXJ0_9FLAO|nr:hypothetical protein [Cellulophaga baltica]SDF54163.1 hypothetical protein SAMN04487992_12314 [Cellulophaga baltica]
MKKTIIAIVVFCAFIILRYYYNESQKKEEFKLALIQELQSGISSMDYVLEDPLKNAIKKLEKLTNETRTVSEINEKMLSNIEIDLNVNYFSIDNFVKDDVWKSIQQSGLLKVYNIDELTSINSAYNNREKLSEAKKNITEFKNLIPLYLNDILYEELKDKNFKLSTICSSYRSKLRKTEYQCIQTIEAYQIAIKILDPENKFIKKRDSLQSIKNKQL